MRTSRIETRNEAIAILSSVISSGAYLAALAEKIAERREAAGLLSSPTLSGAPGGGGNGEPAFVRKLAALWDLEQEYRERAAARDRIIKAIDSIPYADCRDILRRVYVDGIGIGRYEEEAGISRYAAERLRDGALDEFISTFNLTKKASV